MRVQTCPSCGARYNVARLSDGATFQCRRCEAQVSVGGSSVAPAKSASLGLAIAGLLMIGATFLQSNPSFGQDPGWPWETFQLETSSARRATILLWGAAGLWALLASLVPAGRVRGSVAAVLAVTLAVLCTNPQAAMTIDVLRLPQLLATFALGAGLLLMPREGSRSVARPLAFLGGAALVLWHVMQFPSGSAPSGLRVLWDDLTGAISGGAMSDGSTDYIWEQLVPTWAGIVAGAIGVLTAFGARWRAFTVAGFVALLASLLMPSVVAFAKTSDAFTGHVVSNSALDALVSGAVALFALGTAALVDLARSSEKPA